MKFGLVSRVEESIDSRDCRNPLQAARVILPVQLQFPLLLRAFTRCNSVEILADEIFTACQGGNMCDSFVITVECVHITNPLIDGNRGR